MKTSTKIRMLLGKGIPQARICRLLGVSPSTVKRQREKGLRGEVRGKDANPYFCKGCNSTVTLRPCVVCQVREKVTRLRAG